MKKLLLITLILLLILLAVNVGADEVIYGHLYVQYNTTADKFISRDDAFCNSSNCYSMANLLNTTATPYTAGSNITIVGTVISWSSTWSESIFVKQADIISYVGNWSADKPSYYNKSQVYNTSEVYTKTETDTQITDANDSMKSYVDAQDTVLDNKLDSIGNWTNDKPNYYNRSETNDTFIKQTDEGNLNVNSSNYWGVYQYVSDLNYKIISYWTNITDRPTYLSNFTDDLGNRGYTSLDNFTNDPGFFNDITNFTGTLTDTKYCTYDATGGIINCSSEGGIDTDTHVKGDGIYLYNDSDTMYLNETKLNATIDERADADTRWAINTTSLENQSGILGVKQSWLDSIYAKISDLVGYVGNWSADKSDYSNTTTIQTWINDNYTQLDNKIDSVGNWSDDKGDYYNKTQVYNQSEVYTKTETDTQITTANDSMKSYVDAQDVIYNDSMKSYTDATFITQANEGNLNVNDSDYLDGEDGSYYLDDTHVKADDNYLYNDSDTMYFNESKLEVIFYNASAIQVVTGTGAGTLTDIQIYDQITYNVTETNSDFELIVNFTGVIEFTTLIVRHKSDVDAGHIAAIQIWDYNTSSWEGYGYLTEATTAEIKTLGVYDSADHISDGVVQVRFYQEEGPPHFAHIHQFDWVTISKGFGTPVGQEIDPLSIHRDGVTPLTANWDQGPYNLTDPDSWFLGKVNASSVQNDDWIETSDEGNLNVNSSDYWDTYDQPTDIQNLLTIPCGNVSGATSDLCTITDTNTEKSGGGDYLYNDSTSIYLNETILNATIDDRDSDTDTHVKGDDIYLYNDSDTMYLNETKLNSTISDKVTTANTSMKSYVDAQDVIYNDSIKAYTDTTFITLANEGNLNVNHSNSTDYWDNYNIPSDIQDLLTIPCGNVSGATSDLCTIVDTTIGNCSASNSCPNIIYSGNTSWITDNQITYTNASFDLSQIPNTGSTYLWGLNAGYIYNNSNNLDFNETKLNATIDARDSDTTYTNASFDLSQIPTTGNINVSDGTTDYNISIVDCIHFASGGSICSGS